MVSLVENSLKLGAKLKERVILVGSQRVPGCQLAANFALDFGIVGLLHVGVPRLALGRHFGCLLRVVFLVVSSPTWVKRHSCENAGH